LEKKWRKQKKIVEKAEKFNAEVLFIRFLDSELPSKVVREKKKRVLNLFLGWPITKFFRIRAFFISTASHSLVSQSFLACIY